MFCFDIETLGVESNSVILSAAITHWMYDKEYTYADLVQQSLFVKFDVKPQVQAKRIVDSRTLEWWEKQGEYQRKRSFRPNSEKDVHPIDGLNALRDYYNKYKEHGEMIWIRGSLDQVGIDSLARSFKQEPIAVYNAYRDVRTAIDLLTTSASGGYAQKFKPIPMGFNTDVVIKHDPVHDCAYDIIQLRYGI